MRNDFAHEWGPIDFDDPRCVSRLSLLIRRSERQTDVEETLADEEPLKGLGAFTPTPDQLITRMKFVGCVWWMLGDVDKLIQHGKQGHDLRPIVRRMEEEEQ